LPREDDIGKRAALAVAQAPLPPLPSLPELPDVTQGPAPLKPD
jgi:hypothetical protein